jgi:hypothetical protein
MDHVPGLAKLHAHLQWLRSQYEELDAPTDTNTRFAVHQSLVAVIDFLEAQGWRGVDFALVKMTAALADIEEGRTVDWVSNPAPNRPPIAISVAVLRGRLAGLMQLHIDNGSRREEAAKKVFKDIPPDSPVFEGVKAPSWKTVARWRDNVTGSAPDSAEKQSFDAMLALAQPIG